MNLPPIDIPVQLPFEVPVLVHPVIVHFAIAIPVIVFLLELANIKVRNRAVSVTSLFLMTLAVIVYAGAFFSGKADGSHAWSLLSADAKEELKFHKLLGTYMVYAMGILFLLKLLAMLVKRPWARDMFIAFLLVFIGVMFKQGKDGGELVYEYGVNVEPVTKLQERVDEMEYDINDLKNELKKAKASAAAAPAATEETAPAESAPAQEEATPESQSDETPATESETNTTQSAVESAAHDAAAAATETVEEAAKSAADTVEDAVNSATESAGDALQHAASEATQESTAPAATPTH